MTDYYPLLSRAITALENNNAETRSALYERARSTLLGVLREIRPPLPETVITRERLSLEEAIKRIEAEHQAQRSGHRIPLPNIAPSAPARVAPASAERLNRASLSSALSAPLQAQDESLYAADGSEVRARVPSAPPPAANLRPSPPKSLDPTEAALAHRPPMFSSEAPLARAAPSASASFRLGEPQSVFVDHNETEDAVEFAVSHPQAVGAKTAFALDAWIYRYADRNQALRRALAGNRKTFKSGGSTLLNRGAKVTVRAQIGTWKVVPPTQTVVWTGQLVSVPFVVSPTEVGDSDHAIGKCTFSVNGLRIGQINFLMPIRISAEKRPSVIRARPINSAFASYASKDRRAVLARIQGMEKLGIDVFMDVRDLKSGANYPTYLLQQIDSSDVLFLFWSRHAKHSRWVEKEWRYGLQEKGIDFIDPVPLVDPRKVPPPQELADVKHFNDWTLAYLTYEKSIGFWQRFRSFCGFS